jgi:hypothetical protein
MGRKPIGAQPMTVYERVKRQRQRQRGILPNERELSDKQKLTLLRAEIRMLRKALWHAEQDAKSGAEREFGNMVEINSLKAKLARLEKPAGKDAEK